MNTKNTEITIDNFYGKSDNHLIELDEFKNCRLTQQTAVAFRKMCQAAKEDGIDIVPISSFRNYERQLTIWNEKYLGDRKVLDNLNREVKIENLTGVEACYAIMYWSALPGLSRHHWGTDIDVIAQNLMPEGYELKLTSDEYEKNGIFEKLTDWLDRNMEKFGFYRPFTDESTVRVGTELWHISYREEAQKFAKFITAENIENVIRNNKIAGKYCLLGMVDEILNDYIPKF